MGNMLANHAILVEKNITLCLAEVILPALSTATVCASGSHQTLKCEVYLRFGFCCVQHVLFYKFEYRL